MTCNGCGKKLTYLNLLQTDMLECDRCRYIQPTPKYSKEEIAVAKKVTDNPKIFAERFGRNLSKGEIEYLKGIK